MEASQPTDTAARLRSLIRWEDALLALVALVGAGVSGPGSRAAGPITGVFVLVAIAGILACLLTRGPGELPPLGAGEMTFQGWARFPLAAGVGMVSIDTLPAIGIGGGGVIGLVFLAVIVSAFVHRWLPVIPVAIRRLLVLPMGMVGAGAFDRIIGSHLPDIMGLINRPHGDPTRQFLPLILAAAAAVYVMLVVAPHAIADPVARRWPWVVRFGLLLLAAVLGNSVVGRVVTRFGL